MSWVSTFGRRVLQAYSDGLVMQCPIHRAELALFGHIDNPLGTPPVTGDTGTSTPAAIGLRQDDVVPARSIGAVDGAFGSGSAVRH